MHVSICMTKLDCLQAWEAACGHEIGMATKNREFKEFLESSLWLIKNKVINN